MSARKRRILRVVLRHETDTGPDLSYLGEYSSAPGPDDRTVDRQKRGDMERGEYRYFVAAMSGAETGNPKSVNQDYRRMEEYNRGGWCMTGVWAEAEVVLTGNVIQTVRSGGLWGIESDSDDKYFKEVEAEQLGDLRTELRAAGFTLKEIDKVLYQQFPELLAEVTK